MKKLYAPWRHDYINNTAHKKNKDDSAASCVFCNQLAENNDDKFFIIRRFLHCVVIMNLYPYNAGHVMVIPYQHKPNLDDLTPVIRAEMMEIVSLSTTVLGKELNTESFNIGINLGIAGGGGLPAHLHIHVLPRWRGDTNFLETIGQTKIISSDLEKLFPRLKTAFGRF